MQGDSFGIRSSHIDRCITLDDVVLVTHLVKYLINLTIKKNTVALARYRGSVIGQGYGRVDLSQCRPLDCCWWLLLILIIIDTFNMEY